MCNCLVLQEIAMFVCLTTRSTFAHTKCVIKNFDVNVNLDDGISWRILILF